MTEPSAAAGDDAAWPPAGWGDWIDLGSGVWITRPVETIPDGDEPAMTRSWLAHSRADGRHDALGRVVFGPGFHTIVALEPLELAPSLLCPDPACGLHGFVRGGRWIPA